MVTIDEVFQDGMNATGGDIGKVLNKMGESSEALQQNFGITPDDLAQHALKTMNVQTASSVYEDGFNALGDTKQVLNKMEANSDKLSEAYGITSDEIRALREEKTGEKETDFNHMIRNISYDAKEAFETGGDIGEQMLRTVSKVGLGIGKAIGNLGVKDPLSMVFGVISPETGENIDKVKKANSAMQDRMIKANEKAIEDYNKDHADQLIHPSTVAEIAMGVALPAGRAINTGAKGIGRIKDLMGFSGSVAGIEGAYVSALEYGSGKSGSDALASGATAGAIAGGVGAGLHLAISTAVAKSAIGDPDALLKFVQETIGMSDDEAKVLYSKSRDVLEDTDVPEEDKLRALINGACQRGAELRKALENVGSENYTNIDRANTKDLAEYMSKLTDSQVEEIYKPIQAQAEHATKLYENGKEALFKQYGNPVYVESAELEELVDLKKLLQAEKDRVAVPTPALTKILVTMDKITSQNQTDIKELMELKVDLGNLPIERNDNLVQALQAKGNGVVKNTIERVIKDPEGQKLWRDMNKQYSVMKDLDPKSTVEELELARIFNQFDKEGRSKKSVTKAIEELHSLHIEGSSPFENLKEAVGEKAMGEFERGVIDTFRKRSRSIDSITGVADDLALNTPKMYEFISKYSFASQTGKDLQKQVKKISEIFNTDLVASQFKTLDTGIGAQQSSGIASTISGRIATKTASKFFQYVSKRNPYSSDAVKYRQLEHIAEVMKGKRNFKTLNKAEREGLDKASEEMFMMNRQLEMAQADIIAGKVPKPAEPK